MKRRKFGLMAGSSLAASATMGKTAFAQAATPDPSLLNSKLTPVGAERAGNVDGSIPPWTGGAVSPPLPPNQPVDVPMFMDEKPLYTVDASNMEQYKDLLAPGIQELMRREGFVMKVYQSHRTWAAPQWIYENAAKNVTRASLNPKGGRLGCNGSYGAIPFPFINTADPEAGGAQLIWNHLLAWGGGHEDWTKCAVGFVCTGNNAVLTLGVSTHYLNQYYDPNGSPETFDGYFTKLLSTFLAPPSSAGQEALTWTSTNVLEKPDITWAVVNGQGRVRKAPDEAYDTPNPSANGINNYDDASCFAGSPQKYDWKVLGKKEMLIAYNNNKMIFTDSTDVVKPGFPNPDIIRWEKHRCWVLEATLHPGERNVSARRMFYIDEDSWIIALGDCYDANDKLYKHTTQYYRCVPSLPTTYNAGYACWNFQANAYTIVSPMKYKNFSNDMFVQNQSMDTWDPQQMAASASF